MPLPLDPPVVEAYGISEATNWVVLTVPDFPTTIQDGTITWKLKRMGIVRTTKSFAKLPGMPATSTAIRNTVVARNKQLKKTKRILDNKKTGLTSGAFSYHAFAVYIDPNDQTNRKRRKEVSPESTDSVILSDFLDVLAARVNAIA